MARSKRKQSTAKREQQQKAAPVTEREGNLPTVWDYVIQLGVFVVFCLISALLVYLMTGYTLGLKFFFGVLILGFFIVCVFSYIHDRLYNDQDNPETSGP